MQLFYVVTVPLMTAISNCFLTVLDGCYTLFSRAGVKAGHYYHLATSILNRFLAGAPANMPI